MVLLSFSYFGPRIWFLCCDPVPILTNLRYKRPTLVERRGSGGRVRALQPFRRIEITLGYQNLESEVVTRGVRLEPAPCEVELVLGDFGGIPIAMGDDTDPGMGWLARASCAGKPTLTVRGSLVRTDNMTKRICG